MKNIYEQLKNAGVQIDHHESNLYCPVSEVSKKIIEQYEHKSNVTTFRSAVEGNLWYDIPFAYAPWWNEREDKCNG